MSPLDARQQPVRGLTAGDFTILEDGKPQSILTFLPVDAPPPVTPRAAWMRDIPEDIVSNGRDARRLVVIVMNDALTGYDRGESRSARAIGRAAIDELGPGDMAAVVFTFSGKAQNFTTDRTRLLAAVDSFRPRNSPRGGPPLACRLRNGCVVDTLTNIAAAMRMAPPGRKLVIFIGSAGGLSVDTDPFAQMTPVQEMFRAMQEANVTVNTFDPAGLRTHGPVAEDRSAREAIGRMLASRGSVDELHALAENTGGRTFVNTNAPEAHVPSVFEQSGSYYLLGFHSTNPDRNGRFRRVQIKVNRPGATVRTRSGYFAPRRDAAGRSTEPPRSLDAALESGVPARELPVQMHVAMFAVPGEREAAVMVTATLRSPVAADAAATRAPFEVLAAAFDTDLRPRGRFQQTVRLPASEGDSHERYDVHSRLPLRPGGYELRLAVEHDGRTGSVFTNVDVPDFSREGLALSSLVLARVDRPPSGGPLSDLIPVAPTASRDFEAADRVTAFLRIYQADRALAPVTLTTRIHDENENTIFEQIRHFAVDRFAHDRSVDYELELPLTALPPGQYLLVVEARRAQGLVRREVRFTIR